MKVEILIDHFTPCLLDNESGMMVDTTFVRASRKELTGLRKQGWQFQWRGKDLQGAEIYKLCLKGDEQIQGLVAIRNEPQNMAYHLQLAESAPHNRGEKRRYDGVGGHLFAIAAQRSKEAGYGGFIYFEAKNTELVAHYQDAFGAYWIGRPHEYSMIIDEEAAQRLLDAYTLLGGA